MDRRRIRQQRGEQHEQIRIENANRRSATLVSLPPVLMRILVARAFLSSAQNRLRDAIAIFASIASAGGGDR
jgi:hypothetical protein